MAAENSVISNAKVLHAVTSEDSGIKLSICISTRNRAKLIGATLESILVQTTNECEVVVFDGASTDETMRVIDTYKSRFDRLRYYRQEINDGLDQGFDHAVELASGEYCWLMPDDDLLKPGAVADVLAAVHRGYDLVVVNVEYKDFESSSDPKYEEFDRDCEFGPGEMDELFAKCWSLIRYTGAIAIRRAVWMSRERARFYGSFWMDVAVVFQEQLPNGAYVIAAPSITVRMGNQSWLSNWFEIFWVNWPKIVSSLAISDVVKKDICADKPWGKGWFLLVGRAAGQFSLQECRHHVWPRLNSVWEKLFTGLIAVLPGSIAYVCVIFYCRKLEPAERRTMMLMLSQSRFNFRNRMRRLHRRTEDKAISDAV